MDYFLLEQESRYTNIPVLEGLFYQLDRRDINCQNAHKIPRDMVVYVKCKADCDAPSVLTHDLFLISEDVKRVLTLYDKNLVLKNVVLVDYERSKQFMYSLPIFEYADCLGPSSEYRLDSEIVKPVLNLDAVRGRSVFRIDKGVKPKVVVRLDVAESLMRRGIVDLKLEKIAIES